MTDTIEILENDAHFGAYRIRCELGRGGMGVVYRASGPGGRDVALKVLHARAHPDVARRFERETHIALEVRHDNIANALDAGSVEGRPYLASEFVDGVNVAQLVTTTGRLPEELAKLVARDIGAALCALADARTLHRDLKPQNILVARDGSCRVVDFGLALPRTGPISLRTQTGAFLGTPLYVAPEQILGEGAQIDARCDLYALGCVLFYCLVGRAPYRGRSQFAILQQHLDAPIPDLAKLDVEASPEMKELIETLLAKDPDRRPRSAAAMLDERGEWWRPTDDGTASELGRRAADAALLMQSLGAVTRTEPTPFVADPVDEAAAHSSAPERLVALASSGAPGPAALRLRSRGPGRRWIIDVVAGDTLFLGSDSRPRSVAIRIVEGVAVIMLETPGVDAALNDRSLETGPRPLTRRARVNIGTATFNGRLVSPPDDDELLVGDELALWGPAVVIRDPTAGNHSRVLVPGRFVLPGGAEIVAVSGGLWLREESGCRGLQASSTFRSGAIEVAVEAVTADDEE